MTKQRALTFDFLKSIAIFLVIWGHSMAIGTVDIYHNINGRWIVLMNMPLFMFIVGYFSVSSIKRSFREMLVKKWHALLVPTLIYGVITSVPRIVAANILSDNDLLGAIHCLVNPYWFIWAIMCCLIYYKCFSKVFSRYLSPTFLALISWSFLMLMPHTVESSVLSKVQSMYPFFTLGLLFRTYKIFDIIKRHIVVTLLISTAVFITMYVLFKPDQYFYHFQAMKTSQWLLSYAMTIVAGLAGIMICYLISLKVSQIEKTPIIWLNSVGQYTLAIYLEQTVVFSTINLLGLKLAYVWQIFLMALVIFIGLASVTKLVSRYPRVSIYLLGK